MSYCGDGASLGGKCVTWENKIRPALLDQQAFARERDGIVVEAGAIDHCGGGGDVGASSRVTFDLCAPNKNRSCGSVRTVVNGKV